MTINLEKATVNDKRRMLSNAIKSGFLDDFDLDKNEVFIGMFDHDTDTFKLMKHSFTMTDTKVEIAEEGVEVIEQKVHIEVEKELDKSFTDKVLGVLTKHFGSSKDNDINVIKQFGSDDGVMYAIEPLYIAPGEVDGHGDTMDLEGITEMVDSINKANDEDRLQSGLFHKHKTDVWTLDKAWVNPTRCMIGDQLVPEGQPIAKTLFTNERAYEMRINGDISGLSIGARAKGAISLSKGTLSSIQSTPQATRQLVGVHFDWEHPELTYTSPSQGGAASLKNEAYDINKAKKALVEDLDDEQVSILKDIGEEFISLEKHLDPDNTQIPSSSSEEKVGEETKIDKGTNPMSENTVTREEFEVLEKALAVSQAVNGIAKYEFESEVNKAVAGAIATLSTEDKEAVEKAFDALVTRGDEALEKAKKAAPAEESELSKALGTESGEGGEAEAPVEKTLVEKALERQAQLNKGDK